MLIFMHSIWLAYLLTVQIMDFQEAEFLSY